jgi:hypothetical protein
MDEESNAGDNKNHHPGELIELKPEIRSEASCLDPTEVVKAKLRHLFYGGFEQLGESQKRQQEGKSG